MAPTTTNTHLTSPAGSAALVTTLVDALTRIFTTVNLGLVSAYFARDELRARLRATTPRGIPLLTEAGGALSGYLNAEQHLGRLTEDVDTDTVALTLIGTGHLLFAGEAAGSPEASAVEEIVAAITIGIESR